MRRLSGTDLGAVAPALWSLVLALLLLGGALGPGYVLTYDMVWVRDLSLGRDALGLGTALPRAVPSDAVVAVLDEVLGGMLLQKIVLLVPLVAAGAGAAAIVGSQPVARLVAASFAVWNPFVAERLAIGHWPMLIAYGVLPWVIVKAADWRRSGRLPASLPVLVLVGSLSATAGLVTAAASLAAAAGRDVRRTLALGALLVVANLPWVVSGLLHVGDATSSAAAGEVFAPGREGLLPAPVAFLTLGGIWNIDVVPVSRTGWLGVALTAVVVALSLTGAPAARRVLDPGLLRPLVVCWGTGMVVAVLTWAFPDASGWLGSRVPGAGLLRDGSRVLALAAPLVAVVAGHAAAAVVRRLPDAFSRAMIAGSLAVAPVALMPDAALGLSGRLVAVSYPEAYERLARTVEHLPEGDAVLLPFQSYRAPSWNGSRPVLAPLPRYLPRRVVVNDELVVDDEEISGEDPQAAEVELALALDDPAARAAALVEAGITIVVVEDLGVVVPEVAGDASRLDGLTVIHLGQGSAAPPVGESWVVAMGMAWTLWCSLLVVPVVVSGRRLRHSR